VPNLTKDIALIVQLYIKCARDASVALFKGWLLIPASLIAYAIFTFLFSLVAHLGVIGGFIAGFIYIALLSFFYHWIASLVRGQSLRLNSLIEFDWSLFICLISVGFVLWIIHILTDPFAMTNETQWLYACIQLGLFVLLNSIPEVVYLKRFESIGAVKYSFGFIRDNWIEWFIPFILILLPLIRTRPLSILTALAGVDPFSAGGDPLFPVRFIFSKIASYLSPYLGTSALIFAIILAVWFMLFRGFLFLELDGSSRRQRRYKSRYS